MTNSAGYSVLSSHMTTALGLWSRVTIPHLKQGQKCITSRLTLALIGPFDIVYLTSSTAFLYLILRGLMSLRRGPRAAMSPSGSSILDPGIFR